MNHSTCTLFRLETQPVSQLHPSPENTIHNPYFFKRLLCSIALVLFGLSAQAQISFTFNNITYQVPSSISNLPTNLYNQYLYPGTTLLVSPINGHYNCHAFAWANDTTVWLNSANGENYTAPQIYYSTGYYIKTGNNGSDESDAEIAVYGPPEAPTHSALRITNSYSSNGFARQAFAKHPEYAGWYISKWDGGPLVIHTLLSCPFYNSYLLKPVTFYRKAKSLDSSGANNIKAADYSITGSNVVCSCGTPFQLLNCPQPKSFTVTWNSSSNITLNTTVYPIIATANGNKTTGYIEATLHFQDGTSCTLDQYPVWVGYPENIGSISTSQYQPGPGTSHNITVSQSSAQFYGYPFNGGDLHSPNPVDSHGVSNYSWTCQSFGGPPLLMYQNPSVVNCRYTLCSFNFSTGGNRQGILTLQASNACGSTQYQQSILVTSGYTYSLSPNPASNEVTVTISNNSSQGTSLNTTANELISATSASESSGAPVAYTVRIIDNFGSVYYTSKKTGNTFTLPVNQLKRGTYIVEISDGKIVSSKPLIISR